jgi:hypothetical protein
MNSVELAKQLIERAKNLQEFIVTRKLPEGFCLTGVVPFDMWIDGRIAEIRVWAISAEEADELVTKWLNESKL